MLTKGIVQRSFLVSTFFSLPNNQGTWNLIIPSRETFGITSRNNHRPCRYTAFYFHGFVSGNVNYFGGGSQNYIGTQNGLFLHTNTFHNNTSGTDKGIILNNYRSRLQRFQYATNTNTTT